MSFTKIPFNNKRRTHHISDESRTKWYTTFCVMASRRTSAEPLKLFYGLNIRWPRWWRCYEESVLSQSLTCGFAKL